MKNREDEKIFAVWNALKRMELQQAGGYSCSFSKYSSAIPAWVYGWKTRPATPVVAGMGKSPPQSPDGSPWKANPTLGHPGG